MTDLIDRSSAGAADEGPGGDPPPEPTASAGTEGAAAPVAADVDVTEPAGSRAPLDLPLPVRSALGALLAAAGVIHLVMVPSHWGESAVEGAGFLVSGWLQVALAVGLLRRPARWTLQLSVLVNLVLVAIWIVSRTAGLPFGEHAGHAESISIVDGSAVGFELATVALALAVLLPASRLLRADGTLAGGSTTSRLLAVGVPVVALLLASAAIASPSARDHAAGAHGDHGAMGHEHADDRGLSRLTNGHQHGQSAQELDDATQAQLAVQLAGTRTLVERYPTVADAEAAGYNRAGPFSPGIGAHYQIPTFAGNADANGDGLIGPDEIGRPVLIYDGTEPESPIAGFMYYVGGEEAPEGFVGPNDHWHYHTHICIVPRADGSIDVPFGDDEQVTEAMCNNASGQWIGQTGNMLHVWTVPGYESELGVFNEVNPALTCPDGSYYEIPLEEAVGRETTCRNT
jgi:hypothetical protein